MRTARDARPSRPQNYGRGRPLYVARPAGPPLRGRPGRAGVAALLLLTACSREVTQTPHPPPRDLAPARSQMLAPQDRDFLERAAKGNNGEVAIGALVEGRALSAEVRAYGQRMVADHSAANRQLAQVAAQHRIALPTSLGDHQQGFDRLVDRRLEDFDREFMKVMIGDHHQARALYQAELSAGVDPALKSYAAATLPKIEAHLQHATALASIAEPVQESTDPPTPDAVVPPPASPVRTSPEPE